MNVKRIRLYNIILLTIFILLYILIQICGRQVTYYTLVLVAILYGLHIVLRGQILNSHSDVWFGLSTIISGIVYAVCAKNYSLFNMLVLIVLGFGVSSLICGVIYIDKVHFCISISNFSITVPLVCRSFGMSVKSYVIWQSVLLFVGAMLVYLILRGHKIQNIKGEKYEI